MLMLFFFLISSIFRKQCRRRNESGEYIYHRTNDIRRVRFITIFPIEFICVCSLNHFSMCLFVCSTWKDKQWPDQWTAVTSDGKFSAQFEQTLLVTETGCDILTKRRTHDGNPWFMDNL